MQASESLMKGKSVVETLSKLTQKVDLAEESLRRLRNRKTQNPATAPLDPSSSPSPIPPASSPQTYSKASPQNLNNMSAILKGPHVAPVETITPYGVSVLYTAFGSE